MARKNAQAIKLDGHSASEGAVDESVDDADFVIDVEYEDLLEDDDDHGDDANDFDGPSDPNDSVHEDYLTSATQEGMIETQAMFSIECGQGASKTLDLDWALISSPERGQWRPNAFLSTEDSPCLFFFSEIAVACPEKETAVLIFTSGLTHGDSGSVVIDARTNVVTFINATRTPPGKHRVNEAEESQPANSILNYDAVEQCYMEAALSSKYSDEAEADSGIKPDLDAASPTDCRIIGDLGTHPAGFEQDLSTTYIAALSEFPSFRNGMMSIIQDPKELLQPDSFPTQVWNSFSTMKQGSPNQERLKNLAWCMMHINLRKQKEQEEPRWHRSSDDSIVGPSDMADLGRTSKQKVIQPNLMELDIVTSPENIPSPASLVPILSSGETRQADKMTFSSFTFQQTSGCSPPESVAASSHDQRAQAVTGYDTRDFQFASPLDSSRMDNNLTTLPTRCTRERQFTEGNDNLRAPTSTTTANRLAHVSPSKHKVAQPGEQAQSHALPMIKENMSTLAADEHEGEERADTNQHVSTQSNVPAERDPLTQGDKSVPVTFKHHERLNFVMGAWSEPAEENSVSSTPPTSYYDDASSPSSLKSVAPLAAAPVAKKAFPGAPLMPGMAGKP
ncbi:nitrogen regulatory area [Fusarium pseudocircinatum]|uniref:Nitrogen regulatory area n=1 Tax=Fusarium pseudocircinatum TaxID=56676 RepID=A0A8H5KQT7_9HYPO|nr:nitrogen regulatory area [Fusarium pseudocircinatum]